MVDNEFRHILLTLSVECDVVYQRNRGHTFGVDSWQEMVNQLLAFRIDSRFS